MLGVALLVGGLLGAVGGLTSGTLEGQRRKRAAQEKKDSYEHQAGQYKAKSEEALSNARYQMSYGKDIMESYAQKFGMATEAGERALGGQKAAIGASSVEMSGSARDTVSHGYSNLRKDLSTIQSNADQKWGAVMQERKTSLMDSQSFLKSASYYQGAADDIDPHQEYLDSVAGGFLSGLLSGITGGLSGAF